MNRLEWTGSVSFERAVRSAGWFLGSSREPGSDERDHGEADHREAVFGVMRRRVRRMAGEERRQVRCSCREVHDARGDEHDGEHDEHNRQRSDPDVRHTTQRLAAVAGDRLATRPADEWLSVNLAARGDVHSSSQRSSRSA